MLTLTRLVPSTPRALSPFGGDGGGGGGVCVCVWWCGSLPH